MENDKSLVPAILQGMGVLPPDIIEQAKEYARMLYKSGFLPKHYKDQGDKGVDAIVIALQMGSGLGYKGLQALQNITVINGMPGLKGDAAKALILKSGLCESWEESWEGKPYDDDYTHVIKTKRKGLELFESKFSVAMAKRAKLWITDADVEKNYKLKYKPWYTYPDRMLKYRNLGFAARDMYSDILQGFTTEEELQDYPQGTVTIKDKEGKDVEISPQKSERVAAGVADAINKTQGKAEEAGVVGKIKEKEFEGIAKVTDGATEEAKPPTKEIVVDRETERKTWEMTADQEEAIRALLMEEDVKEAIRENIIGGFVKFNKKKANECIVFLKEKDYLLSEKEYEKKKTEIEALKSKSNATEPSWLESITWQSEWIVFTEEELQDMGTGAFISQIVTERCINFPRTSKIKTNKFIRTTILQQQEALLENYDGEARKSVVVDKVEEKEEKPEPEDNGSPELSPIENEQPDESGATGKAQETTPEPEVAEPEEKEIVQEEAPEAPIEEKEEAKEEKVEEETKEEKKEEPAPEKEEPKEKTPTPASEDMNMESFKEALMGIEAPFEGKKREFMPTKKLWNLLGKCGINTSNSKEAIEKLGWTEKFKGKEDLVSNANDDELIEFMGCFLK